MKSVIKTLVILVGVQAVLVGIWYAVEHSRSDPAAAATSASSRAPVEHLDQPAPPLGFERSDGTQGNLSDLRGDPVVLHFWATWCKPCREELPALLAYAADTDTPVLAVSLDPAWAAVRRFTGGQLAAQLVLGDAGQVGRSFDVGTLPVTYVIDPPGRIRLRLRGPQDWSSDDIRAMVRDAATGQGS